jgi:hypothetical protein
MKTVDIEGATAPLSDYARQARKEAVVVTLRGKPFATVMRVPKGADWESVAIGAHPRFVEIMERSRLAHREKGGVSSEEMRRRLGVGRARKKR